MGEVSDDVGIFGMEGYGLDEFCGVVVRDGVGSAWLCAGNTPRAMLDEF